MTPSAFADHLRGAAARFRGETRGATAVEFAIIAPVLVSMVLGVLMLGVAYYNASTIQWSLERSLRAAMIDETVTLEDIEEAMKPDLERIGSPDVQLTYERDDTGAVPLAVVTATYDLPLHVPFLPELTLEYVVQDVVPLPAP